MLAAFMQNYIVTINFCISHVKQQETEAFNSISFEEHAMLNCGKVSIYIYEKVNKSFHYKKKKKKQPVYTSAYKKKKRCHKVSLPTNDENKTKKPI